MGADGRRLSGTFAPGFAPSLAGAGATLFAATTPPDGAPDATSAALVWTIASGGRTVGAGVAGAAPAGTVQVGCVPGPADCGQLDVTLTLGGGPQTVDFFRLWLVGDAARFAAVQSGEAEDALGLTFFSPEVLDGGFTLGGSFDPLFAASVDPTLRLRTELTAPLTGPLAGPLGFVWLVGRDGAALSAGIGRFDPTVGPPPPTVVPEPTTVALLAVGLAGVARAGRRRCGGSAAGAAR